ncbi:MULTISPECIES: hypothetical protein [unclassified Rhodococcus (in: high G+C Gram-positive bacteria)]|uniref:hypothetical protein n=1 Tax=unclassified Rhodococcus (in: high G+C Gram-positive bacteria) TaxID=192944 RepID=UPI00163B1FD6|nr:MULTISPECIES: hypothetical protein [unclassified Rhodococcus (in: high G+C Gram-positive bacteria)]MBC2644523.1 hypothetical protein [Rhodococcus sp. 3A]MBC2897788.1 hypothetical protein [Rhodococcus sp. 4CII]
MTTASMIPASSIPSRPLVRRSGGMSTAEIKARIEAMFADGADRSAGRVRADTTK